MNTERRTTAQVCIELIKECAHFGEMSEASHQALTVAIKTMLQNEWWSLKAMLRHAGNNEGTDNNIKVAQVAHPALAAAHEALAAEDYTAVLEHLDVALNAEEHVKKSSRKDLAKSRR